MEKFDFLDDAIIFHIGPRKDGMIYAIDRKEDDGHLFNVLLGLGEGTRSLRGFIEGFDTNGDRVTVFIPVNAPVTVLAPFEAISP